MKCQHTGDGEPCPKEATRDIRVVTARRGWRLFLCEDHVGVVTRKIEAIIDQLAVEEVKQEQKG